MYHGVSSVNSDLKKVKNNLDDWLSSMGDGPGGGTWKLSGWKDWFIHMAIYLGVIAAGFCIRLAVLKCLLH